jgi:hypothetical protein
MHTPTLLPLRRRTTNCRTGCPPLQRRRRRRLVRGNGGRLSMCGCCRRRMTGPRRCLHGSWMGATARCSWVVMAGKAGMVCLPAGRGKTVALAAGAARGRRGWG